MYQFVALVVYGPIGLRGPCKGFATNSGKQALKRVKEGLHPNSHYGGNGTGMQRVEVYLKCRHIAFAGAGRRNGITVPVHGHSEMRREDRKLREEANPIVVGGATGFSFTNARAEDRTPNGTNPALALNSIGNWALG